MTELTSGTLVVVADGEKALFLVNEGDADHPNLVVVREIEHPNPPTREQGSDRPGRYNDGPSVHRSAVEDTDWHRLEKERFAKELCDRLYRMAHAGRFQRLIVVAPPRILGEIRKDMHKEVAERVVKEVAKELTGHPVDRIEQLIA